MNEYSFDEHTENFFNKKVEELKMVNSPSLWRIKVDGKFITTNSNKTVWKKINHAKSALRNHMCLDSYNIKRYDQNINYSTCRERMENLYQKFLKERVEFVQNI